MEPAKNEMTAEETEFYSPVPPIVTPGANYGDPPSDAIVLFDGKNLDEWVSTNDTTKPAGWMVADDVITVNKRASDIETKRKFTNYQLHIEFRIPTNITGSGQARGNSGIFLAAPHGASEYELQVLDNYNNTTYVNGQVGSIYKQSVPLANPSRKPGEWQAYDVVWTAPQFYDDGTLKSPARVTAFLNNVLVQNNFSLRGSTPYIGLPKYIRHGAAPIKLQAHGDKSEPISYRKIWVRN
ncbi:MAG: DUF1080 domain-containing protein, partial [Bacteroidota bacterium]|nr:DUF1080 domain-containing protein [Bacteroidota bacterium]